MGANYGPEPLQRREDTMGVKRKLVKGALALSVGSVPFTVGASPAGAFENYSQSATFEHTFTNEAGATVVCPVSFSSNLFRDSSNDPFFGSAFTGSNLEDPACDAFVVVQASYSDPAGRPKNAFADSFQGDVFLGVDDVGSGFVANHSIQFLDCASNCFVEYRTQPK
jgi:hypothetical protein